jgi:hypothetical protein
MGTSKPMNLVPLLDLKFLDRACRLRCRNFKSAALVWRSEVRKFGHADF